VVALSGVAVAAAAAMLVSTRSPAVALAEDVAVHDVATSPGRDVVTGTIDNLTAGEVRDVRVLVTHSFLWADERHPGNDSPGRSEVFVIDGPIPPHGSASFRHEMTPPLPPRPDGRYDTSAEIVGFTTIGP
jgi:hypothetical protein